MLELANPERAKASQSFFKIGPGQYGEGDRFLGITVPVLRQLTRQFEGLPLAEIRSLMKSAWHEERLLALLVLVRQYAKAGARTRAAIYRCYLGCRQGINNWDLVDCSAPQIVGAHLDAGGRAFLRERARSRSLWDRRIAVLATFYYIKNGQFDDSLSVARMLLDDREDLIHKAVGWMLREIGKRDQAVLEKFLQANGPQMPRTALRYAIERFPEALRRRYLAM